MRGADDTDSVVKFIVNVRLVENKANSTVGNVIVVNVMTPISMPGNTLAIANKACPNRPSHEEDALSSKAVVNPGVASIVATAVVEAMLRWEVRLVEAADRSSAREGSIACDVCCAV